jgi:F-type H+-transporting ATPase subunit epsilon
MRLKILLPTEILLDEEVTKVSVEAENGAFTMLPRHIDITAALVPGLLSFVTTGGQEEFMAVDEGILVKVADEVLVSTRNAVLGPDLGTLKDTIELEFRQLDDQEKMARTAFAKLEADLVRRLIDLEKVGHV